MPGFFCHSPGASQDIPHVRNLQGERGAMKGPATNLGRGRRNKKIRKQCAQDLLCFFWLRSFFFHGEVGMFLTSWVLYDVCNDMIKIEGDAPFFCMSILLRGRISLTGPLKLDACRRSGTQTATGKTQPLALVQQCCRSPMLSSWDI